MARGTKRFQGFRSGLEEKVAKQLEDAGVDFEFEKVKVTYKVPASDHVYTPDFHLRKTGILVETKGFFEPKDRKKHLWIKLSNPDLDIRFLFQRAKTPITKGSKTTYAMWCEKNGFKWCEKEIPQAWFL